jgi:hypothetical protein
MLLVVEMLSVVKHVPLVRICSNVWLILSSLQLLIARGACITVQNASGCEFQLLPHGKQLSLLRLALSFV